MTQKTVLLFDVDGTLTLPDSGISGVHLKAFDHGFRKVYGIDASIHEIRFGGKTDRQCIVEVLTKRGVAREMIYSKIDRMFKAMIVFFKDEIGGVDFKGSLIERAKECLERFSDERYVLGLVTGNTKEICRLKLEKLDIWNYFVIGGFGDSSEIRYKLVEEALGQARENFGIIVDKKRVYVIGDTPHDIRCARESGTVAVAVSTGKYSLEQLKEFKPDILIRNLSELKDLR